MIFKDHFAGRADPDNTDCPMYPQAIFLASLVRQLAVETPTG
jgi:hypothetical protein